MANEPLPHQLTVRQLRHILEDAQGQAVVVLRLPAGYKAHMELTMFVDLEVDVAGPIVILSPRLRETAEPRA